jgi:hypothetical protein
VRRVERLNFTYAPWPWDFADRRRQEIDVFFSSERKENSSLWNGRLLLLRDVQLADQMLCGIVFETDYASLLAALAWEAMGTTVKACFPGAAVFGVMEAPFSGEMAPHACNAGQLLFPFGSVEIADLVSERVDFEGALRREVL